LSLSAAGAASTIAFPEQLAVGKFPIFLFELVEGFHIHRAATELYGVFARIVLATLFSDLFGNCVPIRGARWKAEAARWKAEGRDEREPHHSFRKHVCLPKLFVSPANVRRQKQVFEQPGFVNNSSPISRALPLAGR
jgi:hypothetical protein